MESSADGQDVPLLLFLQSVYFLLHSSTLGSHTGIGTIAFHKTKLYSFQAASKVFNDILFNFHFYFTSDDSLKSSGWGKGKFRLTFFTESILGISSGCQASEGGFDLRRNPVLLPCAHSGLNYRIQHLCQTLNLSEYPNLVTVFDRLTYVGCQRSNEPTQNQARKKLVWMPSFVLNFQDCLLGPLKKSLL